MEWLKESLSDAIEDFEDGDIEGIPLVPIMDYAQEAMENVEFQEMLKAFGICEPFDEQVSSLSTFNCKIYLFVTWFAYLMIELFA